MSRVPLEHWQQVERVLDQALELPPEAQAAYLDAACAGAPELRREVEALLAAMGDEATFLEAPAHRYAADLVGGLEIEQRTGPLQAGDLIGPYRVLREIGQGGMGHVYLAARADDQFEKQVAVKVVRHGTATGDVLRRFRSERQILASLEHPNIARLLDGGATADGAPYLVMEYVEGLPLDRYCETRGLSLRERLVLFCDVCAAVHFAHQNLVVHRDLKPGNILVTPPGTGEAGPGVVKLLDFGVAKLINPAPAGLIDTDAWPDDAPQTRTGMRMLTPEYASPEQVRGEPITTASDVYSLGVILYALLTGRRPYRVDSRSLAEIERAVCHEEPPRPSTAVMRADEPGGGLSGGRHGRERLRRQLAGDLDTIVLMALRKEPARRYASAQELREDLQRHLDGLPVRARGDTLVYRATKFVRRHRMGVAVAMTVACLGLAFGALYTTEVTRERDRARAEAEKAKEVTRFLLDLFKGADPSTEQRDTLRLRTFLDLSSTRIVNELRDQPEVRAELMLTMGLVYDALGLYDLARPLFDTSLALRRARFAPSSPEVVEALVSLGGVLVNMGEMDEALAIYREALAAVDPNDRAARASVMDNASLVFAMQGDYAVAESLSRAALDLHRTLGDATRLSSNLNNLAYLLHDMSRLPEAAAAYEEALAIRLAHFDRNHPATALLYDNLAVLYTDLGQYDRAEPLLHESLAIRQQMLGPDHPDVATSLNNMALVFYARSETEQAVDYIRQALDIRRRRQGAEHPLSIGLMSNLGMLLREQGDMAAAEATLREVLALETRVLGESHPDVGRALYNVGLVLHDTGRLDEAVRLYRRALDLQRAALPDPHSETASTLAKLGEVLLQQGRPAPAEALLRESVAMWEQLVPEGHWRLGQARSLLGACYTAFGRYDEAERLLLDSEALLAALDDSDAARHLRATRQRLADLYEAWDRSARAAGYRALLHD